jgi:hypothetical protein
MRWAGYVAHMGERRNANKSVVGNPEGKRQLGRPILYRSIILKLILKNTM